MCGTGKGISWTGLPEYHVPLGEGAGDGENEIPFLLFLYSPPPPDTQATVRRVRSFTDILLLTFASSWVTKSTKANPLWVLVPYSFFGCLKVLISPSVLRRRDESAS